MGLFNIFRNKKEISRRQNFDVNKQLVYSLSKSRIPSFKQIKYIKKYLTAKESRILVVCFFLILVSSLWLGGIYYKNHVQTVPARGGEYVEALIGSPKYINPLYSSVNDVDDDLVHLIYSSLFKRDKDGLLVKDLLDSYEVSADGKTYTFKLRPDVSWHNGNALTAEDVVFTFNAIKSPEYKSTLRQSFAGVEIEEVDNLTFKLVLSESYAPFLELLTFGIMPQDLWYQVEPSSASLADLNINPIGSGPYKVKSLIKDKTGIIKSYNLVVNDDYFGKAPLIENLTFKFYATAKEAIDGLNQGEIQGISYISGQEKTLIKGDKQYDFLQLKMPQLTSVFLNSKENIALSSQEVRQALAMAIDRQKIVDGILFGSARLADGPILSDSFAYNPAIKKYDYAPGLATSALDTAGWKITDITKEMIDKANVDAGSQEEAVKTKAQTIQAIGEGKWRSKDGEYIYIKLTTIERDENSLVAEEIKKYWQAIGVRTEVELLPAFQIQSDVIKTRNFDALFYGQVLGLDPDPYAFWHSSQINYPGLNITSFSDKEVDQLLEDARTSTDKNVRIEKYKKFQEIITNKEPAISLYSPYYTYLQSKQVNGFSVNSIVRSYDRFSNISDWYVKTKKSLNWSSTSSVDQVK